MRAVILLALVCCATFGEFVSARHSNLHEWSLYKQRHGKVYADRAEEAERFALFLEAKERVERHNANESNSYKLGLNHLSDWTEEERAKLNGLIHDEEKHQALLATSKEDPFLRSILDDPSPVPEEVDWRKVPGRVSSVKNQHECGSCWAFSTTGLLEGQEVKLGFAKKMTPLSEQDLVDCSAKNNGCDGGLMSLALADIQSMGGIESEGQYPYQGVDFQRCRFNKSLSVMSDGGPLDLPQSEEALKKVVATYGPVAIGLEATDLFRFYKSGIFDDETCTEALNHGVLLVGYGTDSKHGDFWIVKNSWGENWGEDGYIRMRRGVKLCGISKVSTIAKFQK